MDVYAVTRRQCDVEETLENSVGWSVTFYKEKNEIENPTLIDPQFRAISYHCEQKRHLYFWNDERKHVRSMSVPEHAVLCCGIDIALKTFGKVSVVQEPFKNNFCYKSRCPLILEFLFNEHLIRIREVHADAKYNYTGNLISKEGHLFTQPLFTFQKSNHKEKKEIMFLCIDRDQINFIRDCHGTDTLSKHQFVVDVDIEEFILLITSSLLDLRKDSFQKRFVFKFWYLWLLEIILITIIVWKLK